LTKEDLDRETPALRKSLSPRGDRTTPKGAGKPSLKKPIKDNFIEPDYDTIRSEFNTFTTVEEASKYQTKLT
jgi:hypothetical protein